MVALLVVGGEMPINQRGGWQGMARPGPHGNMNVRSKGVIKLPAYPLATHYYTK